MSVVDRWPGLHGYRLGLILLGALLLGWFIIGSWFWPADWPAITPWQRSGQPPSTLVSSVAELYWRTRDAAQVRAALAGLDAKTLAGLLAELSAQAGSLDSRLRFVALQRMLGLPDSQAPLLRFVLQQQAVVATMLLAALPLVAAIILAFIPFSSGVTINLRKRPARPKPTQQDTPPQPAGTPTQTPPTSRHKGQGEQPVKVREVTPQAVSDKPSATQAEPRAEDQAPEAMPQRQIVQTQEHLAEIGSHFSEMQERLNRLQQQMPQMQQPLALMQQQLAYTQQLLGHLQAGVPEMTPPDVEQEMGTMQAHLEQMQQEVGRMIDQLPDDVPPELRAELEQVMVMIQSQVAAVQQQMAHLRSAKVALPAEQPVLDMEALGDLSLENDGLLDDVLVDDVLASVFQNDEIIDPRLEALCATLPDIDIRDLSRTSQEVANRLSKGIRE